MIIVDWKEESGEVDRPQKAPAPEKQVVFY